MSSNIVPFPPPPASPEDMAEFERRVREHFFNALGSAVQETLEETKRMGLHKLSLDMAAGIMQRSMDNARLRFGWL